MNTTPGNLLPLKTKTLPALLENTIEHFPERPSLGYASEEAMTYKKLGEEVTRVASFLQEKGVEPGDRVALLSENSPNWGVAYFSIVSLGAIVVPILNEFHPSEIHHILRHSGARALFVSERLYHKVEEFDLKSMIVLVLVDNLSVLTPDLSKERLKRLYSQGSRELKRIKNLALRKIGLSSLQVNEHDPASIIYTSGTTGHSKGVVLTHRNIVTNAIALEKVVPVNHSERLLSILPLAHVYECTIGMVMPMLIGASIYYLKKPPTPSVLLPALAQVRPTVMLSVPLIIEKIYKGRILPGIQKNPLTRTACKVPALRRIIHRIAGKKMKKMFGGCLRMFPLGGAATAPEVERFMREAGFPYAVGYGLTETAPLVTASNAEQTRLYSVGQPIEHVELRIDYTRKKEHDLEHGIEDSDQANNDAGEILVRGPNIMQGYYQDPELTKKTISPDGWLRTGDLGSIDKDGYVYIRGRLKNMILGPSGENIYPEGIESVLQRSDYVLESLVYQNNGKLKARVHLHYEKLDEELSSRGLPQSEVRNHITKLLESIRLQANVALASHNRLAELIEQPEPFEKTPTHKIKRYLYVH